MANRDATTHRPITPRKRAPDQNPALLFVSGARRGQTVPLSALETTLGKDPTATVVLRDSGVSRLHAKILRAGDGIYNLIDLDSTNGVTVNGVRVEVTVLREGDRVQIGPEVQLVFTYDSGGEQAAAARAAPAAPDTPLSDRQLEVARLVCAGLTNAEIADKLSISRRTVTSHLDHIYNRLDIGSRAELAHYLGKLGLS